jgi:EmrB/QacA subfamily drug resistance transporter
VNFEGIVEPGRVPADRRYASVSQKSCGTLIGKWDLIILDATILPPASTDRPTNAEERLRFRGVFFYVAPAMFIGSLDQTIVAAALPTIGSALGGFADIAWVVTAYLLAAAIATPIYGRLGDAFGRRRLLLWALALFLVGSCACAMAVSLPWLLAARAVQGVGGGGLMTLAQALIGEAVSPKERGRFQGWFGAIFALASTLGPVTGGLLSEHFGWRSIFWVNLPLGGVAFAAALRVRSLSGHGRFVTDRIGTIVFAIATLAFLLVLSMGPKHGWLTPLIVVFAVVSLLGYGALPSIERRSVDPLIPPSLLSMTVIWRSVLCVLLYAMVMFAAIVQLPLFLQIVLGVRPGLSGLLLIPLTLAQVGVSTLTGLRISSTGHPRTPMAAGLSVASVGFVLMAVTLGYGGVPVCVSSIIFGLGLGTIMPTAQTLVQWAAGEARLGTATAILTFTRTMGGVTGTAVAAAVLLAAMHVIDISLATRIEGFIGSKGQHLGLDSLSLQEIRRAFRWVFACLAMLTVIAAAIAWSIPDVDLSSPEPAKT